MAASNGLGTIALALAGVRDQGSRRPRLLRRSAEGVWLQRSQGKAREGGRPARPYSFFVPEVLRSAGPTPVGCVRRQNEFLEAIDSRPAAWAAPAAWPPPTPMAAAKQIRKAARAWARLAGSCGPPLLSAGSRSLCLRPHHRAPQLAALGAILGFTHVYIILWASPVMGPESDCLEAGERGEKGGGV